VEVPTPAEAHRRTTTGGRSSKVHHPSAAQTAFHIPEPKIIRFSRTMRPVQRSA
jgi:hypothetical protein